MKIATKVEKIIAFVLIPKKIRITRVRTFAELWIMWSRKKNVLTFSKELIT